MADAKTICPKCGGHVAFPKELAGKEAPCPHCNENILLPKPKLPVIWCLTATGGCIVAILVVSVLMATHHGNTRKNEPLTTKSQFEILQEEADKGDSEAMVQLGRLYLYGNGVPTFTSNGLELVGNNIPTNSDTGLEWLQKSAALGNIHAMTAIGDVLYDKWQNENSTNSVPIDPATGLPTVTAPQTNSVNYVQSMAWYEKAATLGDTNAMWKIIRNEVGSTNFVSTIINPATGLPESAPSEEGFRWLQKLANGGDTEAMAEMGSIYINETNTSEGLNWLRKAADLGEASAWTTLASVYEQGKNGVTKDIGEAVIWYTKAATNGDIYCELHLAQLYRDNEEVRNPKESFKWFLNVAQEYSSTNFNRFLTEQAIVPVAQAYDKGLGVDQDKTEAMKWYKKAADADDTEAEWRLGVKYDLGDGVDIDKQKALQWYLKVANTPKLFGTITLSGVAEAQRNLGYLYRDGEGVLKDNQEALNWFMKAAENGEANSQYEVGKAYETGVGVLQDKEEALKWYRKAAYQGNKSAQFALGNLYGGNLYSSQNRIESYTWYTLAAAQGDEDAAKLRDIVASAMSVQELTEANRRAKTFSVGELPTNVVPVSLASKTTVNAGIDLNKPAFEVLNATAKVTEQNDMWWRYGYRLTVRNNGIDDDPQSFEIQFLDGDGYVIDTKPVRAVIKSGATEIITGDTLIDLPGAARVSKLKAVWKQ